jgi:hypothetical protein
MDYPTNLTRATAENMLDDAQPGQYVLATFPGRVWIHSIRLDAKQLPRTYCGVPIGVIGKWSQQGFGTADQVTCVTCSSGIAKTEHGEYIKRGIPETKERPSRPAAVCFAVLDDRRVPSATGRHVPNVLKSNYHGEPVSPFCTWCGASLTDQEQADAQATRALDDSTVLVVRDGDVVVTTTGDTDGVNAD